MGTKSTTQRCETHVDFQQRYRDLVSSVDNLPTLPTLLWELQAVLRSPFSDAAKVALVIEKDPSLTAHVLRFANSAYSASRERIISVKDAVARVGINRIERISTGMLMVELFSEFGTTLEPEIFWKHSFRVASVTHSVCTLNPESCPFMPDEVYIAGLLHDIGKLILDQYFHEDYEKVDSAMKRKPWTAFQVEESVLGLHHGEVGADLLQVWDFPEYLVEAIRDHHEVCADTERSHVLAELIRFCDFISYGLEEETMNPEISEHPMFGVTSYQYEEMKINLLHEEKYVDDLLGL